MLITLRLENPALSSYIVFCLDADSTRGFREQKSWPNHHIAGDWGSESLHNDLHQIYSWSVTWERNKILIVLCHWDLRVVCKTIKKNFDYFSSHLGQLFNLPTFETLLTSQFAVENTVEGSECLKDHQQCVQISKSRCRLQTDFFREKPNTSHPTRDIQAR